MNNDMRELLAGYVDDELTDDQRRKFEKALAEDPQLRSELEEFRALQEVTGMAHYADLPDEVWDKYWQSLYRKLERGIGWILVSVGAIITFCYGAYQLCLNFFADPTVPVLFRVGVGAISGGLIFLLVSVGRERIFAYRRDRYKEVDK